MSVSSVFYKSVHAAGQGLKATGRGLKWAWNTAIGNTRLEKRGLQPFNSSANLRGVFCGAFAGITVAAATGDPRFLLLMLSGVVGLNLVSAYRAGKYDLHQEKAKAAGVKKPQKKPAMDANP